MQAASSPGSVPGPVHAGLLHQRAGDDLADRFRHPGTGLRAVNSEFSELHSLADGVLAAARMDAQREPSSVPSIPTSGSARSRVSVRPVMPFLARRKCGQVPNQLRVPPAARETSTV